MKAMCQKIKKLLFHTLVPAVLAVLMLPMTIMAFAQETAAPVSLPVEVVVTGSSIPAGLEYHLVLEGIGQAPMPEKREITIKNGGTASFGPITYTELENYSYRVYQKAGENGHVTYDGNVYTVTVQVVNDGEGGLKANVLAVKENSSDKSGAITFANKYTAPSNGGGGNGGGDRDHDKDHGNGGGGSGGGGSNGGGQITDPQNMEDGAGSGDEPSITEPAGNLPLPVGILPKTGDGSISYLTLLVILAASGILIFWLILKRRRNDTE